MESLRSRSMPLCEISSADDILEETGLTGCRLVTVESRLAFSIGTTTRATNDFFLSTEIDAAYFRARIDDADCLGRVHSEDRKAG